MTPATVQVPYGKAHIIGNALMPGGVPAWYCITYQRECGELWPFTGNWAFIVVKREAVTDEL